MRLLDTGAQNTTRFEIAFWNKVFYPVSVIVMMIVALPFSYFQRRQGGVGFRMFAGTILGLTFFLIGRLFSNLGVLNDWPPLFSAAFPLVAFVVMTVGLLWWLERR
jgi:lipopolysaccharide export system permease protein